MGKLNAWLEAHNARAMWEMNAGRAIVTVYAIRGALVMVMRYPDGDGFDVFTSYAGIAIDATLRDADERIFGNEVPIAPVPGSGTRAAP